MILEERQSYGQSPIVMDITTHPTAWANDAGALQFQVQPFKNLAFCAGGTYGISSTRLADFDQRDNTISAMFEVRWLPFGAKSIGHKKENKVRNICGGKFACLTKKNTRLSDFLKGIYLAPGYRYEQKGLELIPLPHLESPIPVFPYKIKSHAATLNLGYQLRIHHFTLGASYGWAFDQPNWSGPYDIFGDSLYTQIYPWKMRVQPSLGFEVGINF